MSDQVFSTVRDWDKQLCDEEGCNEVAVTERKPSGWLYFYCRSHAEKHDTWAKEYRRKAYGSGR